MSIFVNHFRRIHFDILMGVIVVFSALTWGILMLQSTSDWQHNRNLTAMAMTFSGPFTGAMARPASSSTLGFSWTLFPYSGGVLLAGLILQFIRWPPKWGTRTARLVFWILGLLGWFGSGVVSLLYALS